MFSFGDKKSLIRKSIPLLILSLLVVFVLYSILHITLITATDDTPFNITAFTPTSLDRTRSTLINISIHANGSTENYNITQVIVTLPTEATFYAGTNGTNVSSNTIFSNIAANLIWANISNCIIANGTSASFWFNVSFDTTGVKTFTITTNFSTNKANSTTQAVQVNFTFLGYVKNETGGYQNNTNVSIYRYEASTTGPPTQTFEASVLTDVNGRFEFSTLNGSASQYQLKFICYNASGGNCSTPTPGAAGVASKVGTVIPPFPANMFYPKFTGDQMQLNGTTFYLQAAATIRINATGVNTTGGAVNLRFGYEVIDQKVGFPIESNVKENVSTVDVVVPSGKNYTVMYVRDPSVYPYYSSCNGVFNNDSACPSPPKSNYTGTLTAGEMKQMITNISFSQVYLYGCINISAGANNTNANNQYNITKIVPRMVPWSTSAGLFIPSMKGDMGNIDLSDSAQYNYSGHPSCSGHLAFYNISLMGGGINYLVEFYARNGTTMAGDDNNYYGSASWDLAAFQNVTIGSGDKELNITLYRLAGNFTRGGDVNTSKIRVNIVNSSGDAVTTSMHVEVRVKNSAAGIGTINYMVESLSNGTFYLPILNNSNWARVNVFPNEAPPIEKTLNLSLSEQNITLATISFAGGGDKGIRRMNATGGLECTNTSSMPILVRFLRRGTTDVITEMNATDFNPMKAMVAGSIDMELKVTATNVTMKFNNFDMFSAKQPPMFAVMDNASLAASSQTWKFGNFVPRDVYDNVTLIIPYNDSIVNESWTYRMSISVLYKEDPAVTHQFTIAWNLSAGQTTADLGDEFIEYNGSRYRDYLNSSGIVCGSSSTSVCYMDTTNNLIYMEIPHFSGVNPGIGGSAPTAAVVGGGGPSGYLGAIYNLGDLTTTGITRVLLVKDKIKFKSENVSYNGTVNNLTSATVELTIAGATFTLAVNETKKIDLDADNVYEMSVGLENIVAGTAYVNFKAISESVTLPPEEEVEGEELCGNGVVDAGENCTSCPADVKCAADEECKAGVCEKIEVAKPKAKWLWFVLITVAVIVAVVIYLIIISKKKTE